MSSAMLNLARKWRAQSFDTLVGQELVVKILKNSLFTAHYFPVYLFAGQRGCGKTSTARIFAAALNCTQLSAFQAKPKEIMVPCSICDSCSAMVQARHPDFIEIDAASHTGVDNMRSIIDASYYLPVLGRKKIYLIDEAHMLSKAAFNALLKLFEEPPLHAHFILATTDPEKIIETVRSRCFTLFFGAIEHTMLAEHLKHLCIQEQIEYEVDALAYIARAAEGSARDAINMLETVRFSYPSVTKDAVLRVLGHVDDQQLVQLLARVLAGDIASYGATWSAQIAPRASAQQIWLGLIRLMRGIIWHHYGVMPNDVPITLIKDHCAHISLEHCNQILESLYQIEPLFMRSSNQQGLLEFSLLQLCARFKKNSDNSSYGQSGVVSVAEPKEEDVIYVDEGDDESTENDDEDEDDSDETAPLSASDAKVTVDVTLGKDARLALCKATLAQVADPLLASILSQVISITHDEAQNQLVVHFSTQHQFFADMIMSAQTVWMSLVAQLYEHTGSVRVAFDVTVEPNVEKKVTLLAAPKPAIQKSASPVQSAMPKQQTYALRAKTAKAAVEKIIDVSDKERWPLTNRVLMYFPGTVTVVDEARV